jgi:hypothetical protein
MRGVRKLQLLVPFESELDFGAENAGKLVYVAEDGLLIPLTVGDNLSVEGGVLKVNQLSGGDTNQGSGLSDIARELLMAVLRMATYDIDTGVEDTLILLEKALGSANDAGGGDSSGTSKVEYSVTYNLTGVISDCVDDVVSSENEYYTVLTPAEGENGIKSVVITMGGLDVTEFYYDIYTGIIKIPSVRGDVVISAESGEVDPALFGYIRHDYITKATDTPYDDWYINTEISGDFVNEYDVTMTYLRGSEDPNTNYMFGCRDSGSLSSKSYAMWIKSTKIEFQYCGAEHVINHDFTQKTAIRTNGGRIYFNDELKVDIAIDPDSDYRITNPLHLFTLNQGNVNGGAGGRLYEVTVKNRNGGYVSKLLPCTDGNGVAGLFCTVRKKFFTNADTKTQGSGFVCGNDA